MALQPRDFALLSDVFDSRFITIAHAAIIHFAGSADAAKRRLRRLSSAGLLRGQRSGLRRPAVIYRLAPRGLDLLARLETGMIEGPQRSIEGDSLRIQRRRLTGTIGPGRLFHELATLEVKAALQPALSAVPHLLVHEFGVWPERYEFEAHRGSRSRTKKPDGFLHVLEHWPRQPQPNNIYHYIEVDRGSEARDVVLDKLAAYDHHLQSGQFAHRVDSDRSRMPRAKFRVLLIVQARDSLRRCVTLMERIASQRPHDTITRVTTLKDLQRDPLGEIWFTARTWLTGRRSSSQRRFALLRNLSTDPAAQSPERGVLE